VQFVPVAADLETTPKHGMLTVSVKGKLHISRGPSKATFIGVSRDSF
jgi:hypothetical protein